MPIGLRDLSGLDHEAYMRLALEEARQAGERGDLPIGAVIVHAGKVVGKAGNRIYTTATSINHAEMTALHLCANYLHGHGRESVIYSTLEPCYMCLATIIQSNIRNIVFAQEDAYLRTGERVRGVPWLADRMFNYVGGVLREESRALLERYCSERDYRLIVRGEIPGRPREET